MSLPPTRLAKQPSGASDQDRYPSVLLRIEKPARSPQTLGIVVNDRREPSDAAFVRDRASDVCSRLCFCISRCWGWAVEDREVLFAFPDDAPPVDAVYRWQQAVVTSGMPLSAAIHKAQANGGSEPMEIRLLNRQGAAETVYRLELGSTSAPCAGVARQIGR